MKNNYSVYQHVTPDGLYYFGQTNNIKRRWRNNGAGYKGTALYPYIEKYGWDNIKHIVLFREQTRENAFFIENFLIETAREDRVCINKNRSGNISKEEGYIKKYREEHKDNIKEQSKQYYEQNKDKIKQYREQNKEQILEQRKQYREQNKDKIKQYYEDNKDKIKQTSKQYYETNKDKIREYQREYREQNKEKKREYNRQYYQRKKLEKQLKEAVETTLF